MSVDPLYKKYPELTPYQFASNSSIGSIDRDGLEQYSMSNESAKLKREAEYIDIKLNNRQVQLPPPHPQPTITSTNPMEIERAKQETTRREILNRMYNSDASISIQIFGGVGAAANAYYPEVKTAISTYDHLSHGDIPEALEGLTNLSMLKALRYQVASPKIGTYQAGTGSSTSSKEGYSSFNDGYSREITHINGFPIKNLSYANQTINTKAGPVNFDEYGFPDFNPYAIKTVKVPNLTGQYAVDEVKALGYTGMKATPNGYVWHHHQDAETMMLVPKTLNNPAQGGVSHTGGSAVIRHNTQNPGNQLQFPSPNQQ